MKNENPLQIDLFDQPEQVAELSPMEAFEKRMEGAKMFHRQTSASAEEYVTRMLNVYQAENADYWYDLRDDDLLEDDDVVGHCMACGNPVTKSDICDVTAINYFWQHKDGHYFHAFQCFGKHSQEYTKKIPGSCGPGYYYDFHKDYLRLCGLTEAEYIERLRQDQPTVFNARQGGGQYVELCKAWDEGVQNEVGVYVGNVHDYERRDKGRYRLTVYLVKVGKTIFYEIDYDAKDYGVYSPLTDMDRKLSVFQPVEEILEEVKASMESSIDDNGNLDDKDKDKLKSFVPGILEDIKRDLVQ